jgi:4-amino-4-deoxy-L-arabinose transferase-like glycosyltransferase
MTSPRVHGLLLGIILLLAAIFRVAVLNVPFGRNPEGCAAFFGLVARNYFRYDWSQHHGVPIMSLGQGAPVVYYANHPPTTPLLVGLTFALTGYRGGYEILPGDWQVRLPTAIFTVACIALLYVIVRNRAGPRAGLLAAAMFAVIPMSLVYGGFPDVISPQLVLFALLTFAAYERFHDAPGAKTLATLCACFLGAAIMDWPAFHMVPVMCFHYVLTRKPREWAWVVAFGLFTVAVFASLYVYLALAQHDWLWMKALIAKRSLNTAEDNHTRFTLLQWAQRTMWQYVVGEHTLPLVALAIVGVIVAATRKFRGPADRIMGLLLIWAALHALLGLQAVYQHVWWWWPITPGLLIAAAVALDWLMTQISAQGRIPQRGVNGAIACGLLLLASFTARSAWNTLTGPTNMGDGPNSYSLQEIGDAIRAAGKPNQAVMLMENDDSLDFWYYADRAIKTQVWDPDTFQRRLNEPFADLNFRQVEDWHGRTSAIVIPKFYIDQFPKIVSPLVDYLDARYQRAEHGKFLIYRWEQER